MIKLTHEALFEFLINFLFYFSIGCFGAFLKDLYETLTHKNEQIRLGEVIIGGACATFIGMGLQDTWFKSVSLNLMVLITFILGILGFELFGNLTTITKFKRTFQAALAFKNKIRIQIVEPETGNPQGETSVTTDESPQLGDESGEEHTNNST